MPRSFCVAFWVPFWGPSCSFPHTLANPAEVHSGLTSSRREDTSESEACQQRRGRLEKP
jgi:hypothetical protein